MADDILALIGPGAVMTGERLEELSNRGWRFVGSMPWAVDGNTAGLATPQNPTGQVRVTPALVFERPKPMMPVDDAIKVLQRVRDGDLTANQGIAKLKALLLES